MQLFCKHNYNVIVDKTITELIKYDKLIGEYKYYNTWHLQTLKCDKCNKILHKRVILESENEEENKERITFLSERVDELEKKLNQTNMYCNCKICGKKIKPNHTVCSQCSTTGEEY